MQTEEGWWMFDAEYVRSPRSFIPSFIPDGYQLRHAQPGRARQNKRKPRTPWTRVVGVAHEISTFTIFSPNLNKQNWFGETETKKHVAIHLSDYVTNDISQAKQNIKIHYLKLKPDLLKQQLDNFLINLD